MDTKIVCIADTHGLQDQIVSGASSFLSIPDGDILVHAGDLTLDGSFKSFAKFLAWFSGFPHKHKVFVGGNHDRILDINYDLVKNLVQESGCVYLENTFVKLDGVKIWGSPMTPRFFNWYFMDDRQNMRKYWKNIPKNLDLLITHGPPYKIMDHTDNDLNPDPNVGCKELLRVVNEVKPRFHVFGHIHGGYGMQKIGKTTFANVSICNENYETVNKPVIIEV